MEKEKKKKRSNLGKYLDIRGISQKWLHEKIGKDLYSDMTVSRWCSGAATPSYDAWILITGALDCELSQIK